MKDLELITLPEYNAAILKLETSVADEKVARADAIAAQQKLVNAVEKERDLWIEKNSVCEAALKVATHKRPWWCGPLKFFTLGISGCR